jgi:hypothetical protein
MSDFKSIIVTVGGKAPATFLEFEPPQLAAVLNEGYQIKEVHQIASTPSAGSGSLLGSIILTYVLYKP